jgi:hypothetical protein
MKSRPLTNLSQPETSSSPLLDDVIRFERAVNPLVHLDLDRRVADAKALVKLMRELYEKFITGMTARHQAMTA